MTTICRNGHPRTQENTIVYPGNPTKPYCKPCRHATVKRYQDSHPHVAKSWQANNREYVKAQSRERLLRTEYGMSTADYSAMVLSQGGRCKICGVTGLKLCVDHDHKTGAVRGLLCKHCNFFLGHVEGYPGFQEACIAYLEESASFRCPKN